MATKKIILNELRSLVKQIVKEEDFGTHKDGQTFSKFYDGQVIFHNLYGKGKISQVKHNGKMAWATFKQGGGMWLNIEDIKNENN